MKNLKERTKEVSRIIGLKQGNVLRFVTAIAIPIIFFSLLYLFGSSFLAGLWIANGIVLAFALAILLLLVTLLAGYTVIKSLFLVAGELSLLIFLALSYCDVPGRTALGNEALKDLLILGLVYIAVTFVMSLYAQSKENYKKLEGAPWSIKRVSAVALFLIVAGIFMGEIYLVVNPIILNLCIYR